MAKYKFLLLRHQLSILGIEYSNINEAKVCAEEITKQEECLTGLSYPTNGGKSRYSKQNKILGLRWLISYFESKLTLVQCTLEKLKDELELVESAGSFTIS